MKTLKDSILESLVTEGKWGKIMKGVKSGSQSGPWTIVVIDKSGSKSKVIHQQPVEIRDAIPANYEDIKKKYPKAMISIEDNEGHSIYNEQF